MIISTDILAVVHLAVCKFIQYYLVVQEEDRVWGLCYWWGWCICVPDSTMAVYVYLSCVSRSCALVANLHHQQWSVAAVSTQLLCEMAQQFINTWWVQTFSLMHILRIDQLHVAVSFFKILTTLKGTMIDLYHTVLLYWFKWLACFKFCF